MKKIDLTGHTFGYWIVLGFSHNNKYKQPYWLCKCVCGKEKAVVGSSLRAGESKSCGCLSVHNGGKAMEDLVGQTFNYWTVLGFSHKDRNGNHHWLCKCICGAEKILGASTFRSQNSKSCGCMKQLLTKETNMEKYGVEYTSQLSETKEKIKQTSLERYGVENPNQSPEIQAKTKQTNLDRYGVDSVSKVPEIALRQAKGMKKSITLYHWSTGIEIVCVASYEAKVVDSYLNANHINYLWQPQTFDTPFKTPTGRISTYRPDFYLPDLDKWIEIKGWFIGDALEKWEWFHKEHPNSELWGESKLKAMGIL